MLVIAVVLQRGITAITGITTNGLDGRMNVADAASYSSVLLLNLSDNLLEQSRNNPVVVQQEEMDRVGFEPTTSASLAALLI